MEVAVLYLVAAYTPRIDIEHIEFACLLGRAMGLKDCDHLVFGKIDAFERDGQKIAYEHKGLDILADRISNGCLQSLCQNQTQALVCWAYVSIDFDDNGHRDFSGIVGAEVFGSGVFQAFAVTHLAGCMKIGAHGLGFAKNHAHGTAFAIVGRRGFLGCAGVDGKA